MNKSAKEKAKKRLNLILNSNKPNETDSTKKARWDFNKEYGLNFYDRAVSELDIIINTEIFQGVQENDIIELVFPKTNSNIELSLFFRVQKENFDVSKIKSNISLITYYNEIIREQKINKSSVFVRLVNNSSKYYIDKITITLKNNFLLRKDLFDIMQNMLNEPVFLKKDIKLKKTPNDDISFGQIKSLTKDSKNVLSGLIHSSTQFQFKSISGTIYFLVEISKETYDFSFSENLTKFELIMKFLKSTFSNLKEKGCNHQINIIYFTRIYFSKENFIILTKKFDKLPSFILYSSSGEYFLDIYTNILTIHNFAQINPNKIESEIINKLYKAFLDFAIGFKCKNLNTYIKNISSEYEINFNTSNRDVISSNPPNFPIGTIFESVENFRIMKSNYSNFFECINMVLREIRQEKINLNKVGNLITVISSGDYFPYYNKDLSRFTKDNLYEIAVPLFYIILSSRKQISISKKSFKKYNTFADEFPKNNHSEFLNTHNLMSKNLYDSGKKIKETYFYEPDEDDHIQPKWIKTLYMNLHLEVENSSAENLKFFYRKSSWFKDKNELENEIFNAKKMENIYNLKKKNSINNTPKNESLNTNNFNDSFVSDTSSVDIRHEVNIDKNKIIKQENLKLCNKDRKISTNSQLNEGHSIRVSVLNNVNDDRSNSIKSMLNETNSIRNSSNNPNMDLNDIKELICYYQRINVPEKDLNFDDSSKEFDNDTFINKKNSNNSQMNLIINDVENINIKVIIQLNKDTSMSSKNRNVLNDLEISYENDFEVFKETIAEIPLLGIFSDFTAPKYVIKNYQIVLKEKSSFLQEIIFERLNKNFQIVKKFAHNEECHRFIDFNNFEKIILCEGKYYHEISLEGENIFIKISKFKSNKQKKINESSIQITESKLKKTFEYNLIVLDWQYKYFQEKNIKLNLHSLDWQTFDLELNKKELYQIKNKIDNELNFLIFEDRKKARKRSIKSHVSMMSADLNLKKSTSNNNSIFSSKSQNGSFLNEEILDSQKKVSFKKDEKEEETLLEKFMALFKSIDVYLEKISDTSYKIVDNINISKYSEYFNENHTPIDKSKKVFLINFKFNFDWILIEHSSHLDEKSPFYFSMKWISCQSSYIQTFIRDFIKRVKQNCFRLLRIPYYDLKELQAFKRCLEWDMKPSLLMPIFFNIIKNDKIFVSFMCFCLENDAILISEEFNTYLKISLSTVNIHIIKGKVFLNEENFDSDLGMNNSNQLNKFNEFAKVIDMYYKIFSVFNNFTLYLEKI